MNKKMLLDIYKREQARLDLYGDTCSMGKCAMSRIALIQEMVGRELGRFPSVTKKEMLEFLSGKD